MILVRRLAIHAAWLAAVVAATAALAFAIAAVLTALAHAAGWMHGDPWESVRGHVALALGIGVVAVPALVLVHRALGRLLEEPCEAVSTAHALASLLVTALAIVVAVQLGGMGATLLALQAGFDGGFEVGLPDLTLLAAALAAALLWLLASIRRIREVRAARPVGLAAGVTRLALYGPLAYFVATAVSGVAQTLTYLVVVFGSSGADRGPSIELYDSGYLVVGSLVPALASIAVLVPYAWYARRLVQADRPFAEQEAVALTRRAAWALVALVSLGWVLSGTSGVLTAAFHAVLGVRGASVLGDLGPGAEAAASALGVLPALIVVGIGWSWHRGEIRRWVPVDPGRAARTWGYVLAWVGLGAAALGAGQAIALLISWAFLPGRVSIDGPERAAPAVASLIVGTIAWALAWWRADRRLAVDPSEAGTTARRAFLAATMVSGFVTILIGLPWVLVQVLNRVFGPPTAGLVDGVAMPIGMAVVGAAMATGALVAWSRDDMLAALVGQAAEAADATVDPAVDAAVDEPGAPDLPLPGEPLAGAPGSEEPPAPEP